MYIYVCMAAQMIGPTKVGRLNLSVELSPTAGFNGQSGGRRKIKRPEIMEMIISSAIGRCVAAEGRKAMFCYTQRKVLRPPILFLDGKCDP